MTLQAEYIERAYLMRLEGAERMPEHLLAATLMARDLMRGDEARFKQGYSFANALCVACETFGETEAIRVSMVAERLHGMLIEEAALA